MSARSTGTGVPPPPARRERRPTAEAGRGRQSAVHHRDRRDGRSVALGWGSHLSRAEKDRIKARLALIGLSGVLALALLLVVGTLLWDKVIVARRPVVRVDGQTQSLQHYANLLSYRQSVLISQYQQASELASQPAPAGSDPAQGNPLADLGRQQMQLVQQQLSNLTLGLVEEMIETQLIRQAARDRGLTASPAEIETELKQIVGFQEPGASPTPAATPSPGAGAAADGTPAATPEAQATARATARPTTTRRDDRSATFESRYRDYLRVTAGTDAIVRSDAETRILRRRLTEQLSTSVPAKAEQVKARHILVPDETAAQAVIERLKQGEWFGTIAAEVSLDTSNKDNGGDLGWFPKGMMVSEFEEAAFKLQPNQVSEPVKTQFGYHVILVEERGERDLTEEQLQQAKSAALPRWLEEEKKAHRIERLVTNDMIEWAMRNGREPAAPRARR